MLRVLFPFNAIKIIRFLFDVCVMCVENCYVGEGEPCWMVYVKNNDTLDSAELIIKSLDRVNDLYKLNKASDKRASY